MSQIKLDYLSAARVHGDDAESFLQAQLTADLTRLGKGEACHAAFCRPSGNVVAVLLIIKQNDGYQLVASAELMDDLITELSRFVLRADVHFEKLQLAVLGCTDLQGNISGECVTANSIPLHYCLTDSGVGDSQPEDVNAWRLHELRSGLTWLDGETTDTFIPQMLGLEQLGALSFRKGCFPGQEVIARVRYLGKLKRRPIVAELPEPLELKAGSKLTVFGDDGQDSPAVVVDSVAGSDGTALLLVARVPEGTRVQAIGIDNRRIELTAAVQT